MGDLADSARWQWVIRRYIWRMWRPWNSCGRRKSRKRRWQEERGGGQDETMTERGEPKSLSVLGSFLCSVSHMNGADITGVQMGGRGGGRGLVASNVHSAKSHFLIKGLWGGTAAQCVGRGRGEERWGKNTNTILVTFVWWLRRLMI